MRFSRCKKVISLFLLIAKFSVFANIYEVEVALHLEGGYHTSSVLKINNKGNIIGLRYVPLNLHEGVHRTYFYDHSTTSTFDLDSPNTSYHVYPLDINDNDDILGYTNIERFDPKNGRTSNKGILLWENFIYKDLTETLGKVEVESNQFVSINNSREIAGFGFELCNTKAKNKNNSSIIISSTPKRKKYTPVSYGDYYTRLVCLNEKGDAAGGLMYGNSYFCGIGHGMSLGPKTRAFVWNSTKKKLIQIGNLAHEEDKYSFALNLNDCLQVVGGSEVKLMDSKGQYFWHAFFWENGSIIDLGTLDLEEDSMACSINNSSEVVGVSGGIIGHSIHENKTCKAFYWTKETGMQSLNSMIDKEAGWNIVWAKDINDLGQIAAFATKNGQAYVVILNPVK